MARKPAAGTESTQDVGVEVSTSSTKSELLEAYNRLREQLEAKQDAALNAERVKEDKRRQAAVEVAETVAASGVDAKIGDLRQALSAALAELGDKLRQETEKYTQVKQAVQFKQAELEEIYGIEQAAASLAALVEAQKQREEEFEAEIAARGDEQATHLATQRTELQAEIDTARATWEKERAASEAATKEARAAEERERKRRQEEFEYVFKRECQQKKDKLADELAQLEKDLAGKREDFARLVTTKEGELAEREARVAAREQSHAALQSQVDGFPQEIEAKVNRAVAAVTERLNAEAQSGEKLLRASTEGEKNVLLARIEALQGAVKSQDKQIADLSANLEAAYAKVQDIAVKAVDSSSRQLKNITVQSGSPAADREDRR
jgi:DNA repair exonuclease SbcCD ATPase subunit